MPLYRVERTVVAIVEAPDEDTARTAKFRSEWDYDVDASLLVYAHDVPMDWRDFPPVDVNGKDVGTTPLKELVTTRYARDY